ALSAPPPHTGAAGGQGRRALPVRRGGARTAVEEPQQHRGPTATPSKNPRYPKKKIRLSQALLTGPDPASGR
ncbi:hypothetical protein, partial [Streptomyces rhizosphaericola]|uniref:hypothetical protein n=1 Tax=Streptomyces rhizosphaericola TaxID=2564098 RepID=UPI003BF4E5ED